VEHPKTHDDMIKAHPQDAALFGTMRAISAELCADVSKEFVGKEFECMDLIEFSNITSTSARNRIYWREMLFRVYWAAAVSFR
jgi:hypothetical protein